MFLSSPSLCFFLVLLVILRRFCPRALTVCSSLSHRKRILTVARARFHILQQRSKWASGRAAMLRLYAKHAWMVERPTVRIWPRIERKERVSNFPSGWIGQLAKKKFTTCFVVMKGSNSYQMYQCTCTVYQCLFQGYGRGEKRTQFLRN